MTDTRLNYRSNFGRGSNFGNRTVTKFRSRTRDAAVKESSASVASNFLDHRSRRSGSIRTVSRIKLFPGREPRSRKNWMDVVDGENGTAQSRENCRQRGQRGRTDKYTSVPISWCRSSLLSGNYRFRFKRHTYTHAFAWLSCYRARTTPK